MSGVHQASSGRWLLRVGALFLIGLLLLARIGYGQTQTINHSAILQGSIQIQSVQPMANDPSGKIQPGTPVKLAVVVENKGSIPSPAAEVFIRFAFSKPIDQEKGSVLFETEKQSLSPVEPGMKKEIKFTQEHDWPSLFDFIKYDWPMREYQAILKINGEEHVIGTMAITFSAYYYPAVRKELPYNVLIELK